MQLKSVTLLAASLALAQASQFGHAGLHRRNGTWGDHEVESDVAPTTKPSLPTGKPPGKTPVADETVSTTWADSDEPVSPETKTTTTPAAPTSTYVYWGDEDVSPDTTTTTTPAAVTSTSTWGDFPVDGSKTSTTTPAAVTSTSTWGDYPVKDTTTTTPAAVTSTSTWGDFPVEDTTTTTTAAQTYWSEVPKPQPSPEAPVSGGEGKPAAPYCGKIVTETVTQAVTVTVAPGKPAATPAPAPPSPATQWSDASAKPSVAAAPAAPAAPAPAQSGYMGIVSTWRSKMGMSPLSLDSTLQSNALDCSQSSGGQLKHKLNPGSMAQVMAPGTPDEFLKVFVGGWLCERPNLPGLSGVCGEMSKGWNYAGQTGHADILTSQKYSKIGCGCASKMWTCDLA